MNAHREIEIERSKRVNKARRNDGRSRDIWQTDTDLETYQKRDYRVKCQQCGRWMRYVPTEKSPAKRNSPPNAGHCTDCVTTVEREDDDDFFYTDREIL